MKRSVRPRLIALLGILSVALVACVLVFGTGCSQTGPSQTTGEEGQQDAPAASENVVSSVDADDLYATGVHHATIEVEGYGTIEVALNANVAPITVSNFCHLVEDGFYDGLTFHRIIEGSMMQGGDPEGTGYGGSEHNIVGEFSSNGYDNPLSHTRGAISMARSNDPNSASSQFFIVQQDATFWDGDYAVFGYVTDGMDVVDAVCEAAQPTDGNGAIPASEQPVINSVTILTNK